MRTVLLIGKDGSNEVPELPEGITTFDYAPFSELFPRAAAIVHQGGVGTTAQAMKSGCPMLVMPYAVDQPDNANRVRRLGIARVVTRAQYSPGRAAAELKHLLNDLEYASRAARIGEQIAGENGAKKACDHLERLLS